MDEKINELIAIGASVAGHCQPCLKYHIEQAKNLGISNEEIEAAISVGKTVEKGALKAMDNFANEQIAQINNEPIKTQESNNNCSCGDSGCCQ
jgi:AhpD family alkylhydroperoxidase